MLGGLAGCFSFFKFGSAGDQICTIKRVYNQESRLGSASVTYNGFKTLTTFTSFVLKVGAVLTTGSNFVDVDAVGDLSHCDVGLKKSAIGFIPGS